MTPSEKHILRITSSGTIRAFVGYGDRILSDSTVGRVQIVATGKTISKAISVAEILKRKHETLHQMTDLTSESTTEAAGNAVSRIVITLSVSERHVDVNHRSYVAPEDM